MRTLLLFICLYCSTVLFAQTDSTIQLSMDQYFQMVLSNHPLSKNADLRIDYAEAYLQKARGNFDPKIKASNEDKYYKNTNYFNLMSAGISIPTMAGLEIKSGYDYNRGLNLNPENSLPDAGLLYAGLTLAVGQGLMIDERRAMLSQAKIQMSSGKVERQALLNQLLYEAGKAYWNWFSAYHQLIVYKQAKVAAFERLQAVKSAAEFGDRPSIDTLEASIQFQERQLSLMQAELTFKNAGVELSLHLWDEVLRPVQIGLNTIPLALDSVLQHPGEIELLSNEWYLNHPEYQTYNYKRDQLIVEKKWKKEQLKPLLNLSYQPLTAANQFATWSGNDYKFGMTFSMPLLFRKERGDLAITRFKIKETENNLAFKSSEIITKTASAINEFAATSEQLDLYSGTVRNYADLLEAEKNIFNNGESSLFMINARELSYISAQIKLIDIAVKNRKAFITAEYAAGLLYKN
ncbi:MAG: TolC family protein [Chitinophagaceae bacterium]